MLSSQRVHITHVKQTHMPICQTNMTDADMEEIAYSQFGICRAVMSNPDALVVKESLYENYTPDLVSKNQNTVHAKQLLPNGIPEKYDELSAEQKDYLARRSGVVTLFDLEMLSHVYKSIGKAESQQINALVAAKHFEAIYEPRERLAIKYSKEAAKSTDRQDVKVLLVFGGVHDFKSRIESCNDNVFYNGCIETSLTANKNEMKSIDAIAMLYEVSSDTQSTTCDSDSISLLSKLSIFQERVDEIDISKIPSSKNELPSPPSHDSMQEGVQELSKLSGAKLRQLNFS